MGLRKETRSEISPRKEGGASVRYYAHDGDSETAIKFEDGEAGEYVFRCNSGHRYGGRQ